MNNNINNTTATTVTPNVDPGFVFGEAYDLGVADNGLIVNETVGGNDEGDIYAFSVNEAGLYNLSLDGLTADADLWLMNGQGVAIEVSDMGEAEGEFISTELTPGNYYALPYSYDGQVTNYTLEINNDATAIPPSTQIDQPVSNAITPQVDPGFTFDTALDLGIVDGEVVVNDSVGGTDAGDTFAFTVSQGGLYNISLDGLTADSDLALTDSQGQPINVSVQEGIQDELISAQLIPGTYYALAESYDGVVTNYSLDISLYGEGFGGVETDPLTGGEYPYEPGLEEYPQEFNPYEPQINPFDGGEYPYESGLEEYPQGFNPYQPQFEIFPEYPLGGGFGNEFYPEYPLGGGLGGGFGGGFGGGIGGFTPAPIIGGGTGFNFEEATLNSEIRHNQFLETIWAE